jgi:hypothetical protein
VGTGETVLSLEREVHSCEVSLAFLAPLDADARALAYRAELESRLGRAAHQLAKLKTLLAIDRR